MSFSKSKVERFPTTPMSIKVKTPELPKRERPDKAPRSLPGIFISTSATSYHGTPSQHDNPKSSRKLSSSKAGGLVRDPKKIPVKRPSTVKTARPRPKVMLPKPSCSPTSRGAYNLRLRSSKKSTKRQPPSDPKITLINRTEFAVSKKKIDKKNRSVQETSMNGAKRKKFYNVASSEESLTSLAILASENDTTITITSDDDDDKDDTYSLESQERTSQSDSDDSAENITITTRRTRMRRVSNRTRHIIITNQDQRPLLPEPPVTVNLSSVNLPVVEDHHINPLVPQSPIQEDRPNVDPDVQNLYNDIFNDPWIDVHHTTDQLSIVAVANPMSRVPDVNSFSQVLQHPIYGPQVIPVLFDIIANRIFLRQKLRCLRETFFRGRPRRSRPEDISSERNKKADSIFSYVRGGMRRLNSLPYQDFWMPVAEFFAGQAVSIAYNHGVLPILAWLDAALPMYDVYVKIVITKAKR